MKRSRTFVITGCIVGTMGLAALAWAALEDEQERRVTEEEVPSAALAALKKLAGGAAITEFSEEKEHGKTYYEGSWKGAHGNVDALVTPAGELVELEEHIPADAAPKSVVEVAKAAAGADAPLKFERKTVTLYEVKFRKDGKVHELLLGPDGRQHEHEESKDDEEKD